jgi:MarR family 2-MHQ and catechol resistance regulon transcriptional repressor
LTTSFHFYIFLSHIYFNINNKKTEKNCINFFSSIEIAKITLYNKGIWLTKLTIRGEKMDNLKEQLAKSVALFRNVKIANLDSKSVRSSGFSVLMAIYNSPGKVSAIEISKYLGFSKVYASKVMKQLLTDGLIYREENEKDRRQLFIYLTEEGKKIVLQSVEKFTDSTNQIYMALGEEKAKEFIEYLDQARKILAYYRNSK